MDWIKNHPIMAGGVALLLVVLFFVFRSKSGGGTQVIQTGPSDAVTAASLQAQVQMASIQAGYAADASTLSATIAGKQIDAQTALALTSAQKDVALQGIISGASSQDQQTQAALLATQYSTQGIVQGEQIQAGQNVAIAGVQADVMKQQSQDQLAAQGIISAASVTQSQIAAGVANDQTDAALEAIKNTNSTNVELNKDTNSTNVTLAGISGATATTLGTLQANSQDLITRTAGNIYTDQIDTQGNNIAEYIAAQQQIQQNKSNVVQNLVLTGQLNKGGEGGSNQVSVIDSWLGNSGGGTAAATAAGTEAVASSPASVISTVGGAIASLPAAGWKFLTQIF